jgi:hypothetical protein
MPFRHVIRPHPALAILVVLAGCASVTMAAEDTILDARLGIGFIPGIRTSELSDTDTIEDPSVGSPKRSASRTLSEHGTIGPVYFLGGEYGQYLDRSWGWVAGAQLFDGSSKGTGAERNANLKVSAYGIEINAGAAYRLNGAFHIECTPFAGGGRSRTTISSGILLQSDSTDDASGDGSYIDYGVKLAGFYAATDHLQIGIYAGYEGFRARATLAESAPVGSGRTFMINGVVFPIPAADSDSGSATTTTRGSGMMAGITLGYSF